ncbi:sensor domain-containing diguanylate cyclase [Bacillus solimangrovi]|uniref:GGDEF domain-containing protein n=1 Tax=Bacillus solimangrovi TaxID=1305675 RepID=A0A1E5LJ43_9BACI|nr:sensor domain-containing diguanylate cyclase [Bacillus solimangrovi]OEH94056.1 hypothetical protein BFG57_09410 [Bacillus solimangrovi]
MLTKKGIKLRYAIGILIIIIVICTAVVSGFASKNALKKSLMENYLESNYNYAKKLSTSTSDLFNDLQQNLNIIGEIAGSDALTQKDLDVWRSANNKHFNSIFITDKEGFIQLLSPEKIQYKGGVVVKSGTKIQSDTVKKALAIKQSFISDPYRATSGQMIMLISSPIFDRFGQYKGLVGGTIYLESDSVLNNTLKEHQYANGSYVYVVNRDGKLIYHPDSDRINEDVSENKVVQQLMKGNNGSSVITNVRGNEFFAGYAHEETTGWGIVSQTPTDVIEDPLHELLTQMFFRSLPLVVLILLLSWILANTLAKPINSLAKFSEDAITHKQHIVPKDWINGRIHIYEVHQLYHHISNHLNLLHSEVQLDGLTQLVNRKTFDIVIKEWIDANMSFAIIMLDIDHFKKVNDTYGHLVGDEVLKFLASIIKKVAREDDLCFRYGGEEFGILVKHINVEDAKKMAERLRQKVAETVSPTGQPITISLGVTVYREEDIDEKIIIQRADKALYCSKANGRNKVTVINE